MPLIAQFSEELAVAWVAWNENGEVIKIEGLR